MQSVKILIKDNGKLHPLNFANGEISVEEIERLYTIIRRHFQKERNSMCLGLQVLLTNIREWYSLTDNPR